MTPYRYGISSGNEIFIILNITDTLRHQHSFFGNKTNLIYARNEMYALEESQTKMNNGVGIKFERLSP